MFDIGFFELVLLGIVGLLVLGPERLPHAIRMGSAYIGKFRRAVLNVREEFEREVNIHEMQQRIKKQVDESGIQEAAQSLQHLKIDMENPLIKEQAEKYARMSEERQQKPFDDEQHSPTLPENEAEPEATPESEAEVKKAPPPMANVPISAAPAPQTESAPPASPEPKKNTQ